MKGNDSMNYYAMPMLIWNVFAKSFRNNLWMFDIDDPKKLIKSAKLKYQEIIGEIPKFEKNDVLLVNILSAAQLAAIYLSLPEKADVKVVEKFYSKSMNDNKIMMIILKNTKNFTKKYQKNQLKQSIKSNKATNPYTWRYKFYYGENIDSFDAIFDKCGICDLFKKLGIFDIVPALCAYDYEMAKYTNTIFSRETTIASGGEVCDCHYKKQIE
ncbi:MAG: L-2-amino-thiazoline-4-carboxylic acid hydrolase [Clostridium sp.]|nr:L-2-amino-thiazoline-4-carboxylic acid hydrolase [Clostridium sp.]